MSSSSNSFLSSNKRSSTDSGSSGQSRKSLKVASEDRHYESPRSASSPSTSKSSFLQTRVDTFSAGSRISMSKDTSSESSSSRIGLPLLEVDGTVHRPNRERKWFVSGPKGYFIGDLNRDLKNLILGDALEIKTTRPETKFYKEKDPKVTEAVMKRKVLDRQEDEKIEKNMKIEAGKINHKRFFKYHDVESSRCQCEAEHPDFWSEQMIARLHRNFYKLKHNGLEIPDEIMLLQHDNITVLRVHMNKRSIWTEKAEQAIQFIDIELGYSGGTLNKARNMQVFIMLDENYIIGCAVVEATTHGYRVISKLEDEPKVSNTPVPIRCGINRMWVLLKYRRQKVATSLFSYIRKYFDAKTLQKDDIGFSSPNELGKLFAASYTGRSDFIIYFLE